MWPIVKPGQRPAMFLWTENRRQISVWSVEFLLVMGSFQRTGEIRYTNAWVGALELLKANTNLKYIVNFTRTSVCLYPQFLQTRKFKSLTTLLYPFLAKNCIKTFSIPESYPKQYNRNTPMNILT